MQIRLLYRKVMIADDTTEERESYQIARNCHWKIPATCHTTVFAEPYRKHNR